MRGPPFGVRKLYCDKNHKIAFSGKSTLNEIIQNLKI